MANKTPTPVQLDINPLKRLVEVLSNAVDFVEQTGPMEQALVETSKRLDALRAEESATRTSVETLTAEIKALTGKKADHVSRIEILVSNAQAQADNILAEARNTAKETKKKADAAAEKIIADANARAAEVDAQTTKAQDELAAITDAIANAAKERTTLQKAIDSLKAKFT